MRIGIAEYVEGPTGCTVFLFQDRATTSMDIRGGGAGTIGDHERNHAICFAGGSLAGLEVVSGVTAALWEQRGRPIGQYAVGCGAIINDYRRRANAIYPDYALGRAAVYAARTGYFPLGARGAGRLANCGGLLGIERGEPIPSPFGNTTLTLVVTNQQLSPLALRHLGRQVHTALGRTIYPFHTIQDGDVLYTVTTNEIENNDLVGTALGILASELAWDAVLASAPQADDEVTDIIQP